MIKGKHRLEGVRQVRLLYAGDKNTVLAKQGLEAKERNIRQVLLWKSRNCAVHVIGELPTNPTPRPPRSSPIAKRLYAVIRGHSGEFPILSTRLLGRKSGFATDSIFTWELQTFTGPYAERCKVTVCLSRVVWSFPLHIAKLFLS